jgi:hypothetical protein
MKWLSVVSISALAFFSNACEKHPASGLAGESEHGPAGHSESKGEAEKKPDEGKPGEAPKFFPDKK